MPQSEVLPSKPTHVTDAFRAEVHAVEQEYSKLRSFKPAPEASALDQLGHITVLGVEATSFSSCIYVQVYETQPSSRPPDT